MTKLYTLSLLLLSTLVTVAQSNLDRLPKEQYFGQDAPKLESYKVLDRKESNLRQSRSIQASGDTLWSSDFSDPSEWINYDLRENSVTLYDTVYTDSITLYDTVYTDSTNESIDTVYAIDTVLIDSIASTDSVFYDTTYTWEIDTIGTNTFGVPNINSATAHNGYAQFWSMDQKAPHVAKLTNAHPIDLSNTDAAYLTFSSYYIKWYELIMVTIRNSKGETDTLGLHFDVPINYGSSNPEQVVLSLSPVAGDSAVFIEFSFQSNYAGYGWQIDDIAVIESEENDIMLVREYAYMNGIGMYGLVPQSLTDSIFGFADIANNGKNDATKVSLSVRIKDGDDNTYDTLGLAADTLVLAPGESGRIFTEAKPMYNKFTGIYNLTYIAEQEENDRNFSNNLKNNVATILITDTTYARALWYHSYMATNANWGDEGSVMAATYFVYDTAKLSSITAVVDSHTSKTAKMIGKVWYSDTSGERHVVAETDTFSIKSFNGTSDSLVTMKLLPNDSTNNILTPNFRSHEYSDNAWPDYYLVGVELVTKATESTMALTSDVSPFHNINWSHLIYPPAGGGNWYIYGQIPHVYMSIALESSEEDTSATEDTSNSIQEYMLSNAQVYPNPATQTVNIAGLEGMDIEVYNVLGKLIYRQADMSNFEVLGVSALPKGNYFIKVIAEDRVGTKKMILGN